MNRNDRFYIASTLVELLAREMRYHFEPNRIARIAEMSLRLGPNQHASLLSIAAAFEIDLLIWGDPKAPVYPISGVIQTTLEEIYSGEEDHGPTTGNGKTETV